MPVKQNTYLRRLATFDELKELSDSLLAEADNVAGSYRVCWAHSSRIIVALQRDIEALFGQTCYTIQIKFILEDSSYRQGASAARLELKFAEEEALTIIAECLIDIGRVFLKVKERPISSEYEYIVQAIERQYNLELVTDIRQIQ